MNESMNAHDINDISDLKWSSAAYRTPFNSLIRTYRVSVQRIVFTFISLALSVTYLLLPIERGFPTVRILGYPFTVTILISSLSFLLLLPFSVKIVVKAVSGKNALSLRVPVKAIQVLRSNYVVLQFAVIIFMFVATIVSEDFTAGMFVVISYFVTFALNFVILLYLFQSGFRREFVTILCIVIAVASLVGVIEGLFRAYIPFYLDTYLNYDFARTQYAIVRPEFRVFGTLGNPIVYGIEMALAIPFVAEVTNKPIKYILIALLLLAGFLTLSTTVVILNAILLGGAFIISRIKLRVLFLAFTLLMLLALVAMLFPEVLVQIANSPQLGRAIGGNASNIAVRQYLLSWTLEHTWDGSNIGILLFGHGLKSSIAAVTSLGIGSIDSLDNTYTTLLYETGTLGLASFVLMGWCLCIGLAHSHKHSLHWYSLLGLLIVGLSFTTIYYSTFNLLWVASVATLYNAGRKGQVDNEVKALYVTAHRTDHE